VTITDLKTTVVSVPHIEPEFISTGMRKGVTQIIVEVYTDSGIIGLGESISRPNAQVIEAAIQSMRPLLLGADPQNIEGIINNLRHVGGWHFFERVGNAALAGVEMALWDIMGKVCNTPVYELLGGMVRDRMPVFYYLFRFPIDEMVKRAKQGIADGYKTIYFKVGHNIHEDIEAVEAVRSAIGNKGEIRIDANEAWTPGTAIRFIKQIEKYDIEWVEQPTPLKDIDGMARVRRAVNTPIAANQTSWTLEDVQQVLKADAADVIVIDQYQMGGLLTYKKAVALCEASGIPVNHHCWGELGIGTAAGAHVVASSPPFLYANQSYVMIHQEDIVVGGLPKIENGSIAIPRKPGLGVELDRDRLAKAVERHQKEGEFPSRLAHDASSVTLIPKL
jgi:L-alanine-DL-glutamate epimerase-like enolase superfamily enzyme